MFIEGFGISSYRSFGDEIQFIGPCAKINIIIGQNNSGKSNVLRFLNDHYQNAIEWVRRGGRTLSFSYFDKHYGQNTDLVKLAFGLKRDGPDFANEIRSYLVPEREKNTFPLIERVLQFDELTLGSEISWFVYESNDLGHPVISPTLTRQITENRATYQQGADDALGYREWALLSLGLGKQTRSGHNQEMVQEVLPFILHSISRARLEAPEVTLIHAVREIKTDEDQDFNYSGINIVKELARLERPEAGPLYEKSKQQFDAINRFVAEVIGQESVLLEVPDTKRTIQVIVNGRTLPLENLGTGVHEVIILAIAATLLQDQVICVEEPEIHLHPVLQKKLIGYLNENTTNQYFIATHSASMIDVPDAAVFHVRHDGAQSRVNQALSPRDRFEITVDLGYRASDILQTNCILWVEGPSDRIYLNHWLKQWLVENDGESLLEGVHYTIMFYGGRLLSHLSADDDEVDEFISLRKINQNLAILIDSDRRKLRQPMNKTKRRVRDEFNLGPGFAWITAGREIENYIPPELMESAVKKVYPKALNLVSTGQYDQLYHFKVNGGKVGVKNPDKVKIAREVAKNDAVLDVFDLPERIRQTARFIRQCNDLK